MNDHLEDRLQSMLAARARSASLEPDLERVVTEGSDGTTRAAVERVAFFAAVAAILAIVVSAAVVFGGGSGNDDAVSGPANGADENPAFGDDSADSSDFASSTVFISTTTTEAGPTTTVMTDDCVVRTTEGAGGSMVEVIDCPTTLTGPGATIDCSAARNTDPSCTSTSARPDGASTVSSSGVCAFTTGPDRDCVPVSNTGPDATAPTETVATHDLCAATTTVGCIPSTPTPTTDYVGSSTAPTTPPATGS